MVMGPRVWVTIHVFHIVFLTTGCVCHAQDFIIVPSTHLVVHRGAGLGQPDRSIFGVQSHSAAVRGAFVCLKKKNYCICLLASEHFF
jgi:hypothetical protein